MRQALTRVWTPSFIVWFLLYVIWRFALNAGVGFLAPESTPADVFLIIVVASPVPILLFHVCRKLVTWSDAAKHEMDAKRQAAERKAEAKRQAAEREGEAKRQAAEREGEAKRQAAEREADAKRQAAAHAKELEKRGKAHAKKLQESAKRQAAKDKADAAKIKADAEVETDARAAEAKRQEELNVLFRVARQSRDTVAGLAAWSGAIEAVQNDFTEKKRLAEEAHASSKRVDRELSAATALNESEHEAAEQEYAKAIEKVEQDQRDAMRAAAETTQAKVDAVRETTQHTVDEQRNAAAEAMAMRKTAAVAALTNATRSHGNALADAKATSERADRELSEATALNTSEHEAAEQEYAKAIEKAEQAMRDATRAAAETTQAAAKAVQQAMEQAVDEQRKAAAEAMEMRKTAAVAAFTDAKRSHGNALADAKATLERADRELSEVTAFNTSEHEAAEQEHSKATGKAEQDRRDTMTAATATTPEDAAKAVQQAMQQTVDEQRKAAAEAMEMRLTAADAAFSDAKYETDKQRRALATAQSDLQKAMDSVEQAEAGMSAARQAEEDEATRAAKMFKTTDGDAKRPMTLHEWRKLEQPLNQVGLTAALVLEYQKGKRCSFWFVRADKLRLFSGTTPSNLQDLRKAHPDWLVQRTVDFLDGFRGAYQGKFLVVSHCWEDPSQPDAKGVQFKTLKDYLNEKPSVEWIWFE